MAEKDFDCSENMLGSQELAAAPVEDRLLFDIGRSGHPFTISLPGHTSSLAQNQ